MRRSLLVLFACVSTTAACASAQAPAAWDSVARVLQTPAVPSAGYVRYNFPRRDLTLRIGDVVVAPALALGAWVGFSGDPADATMMGDLIVTAAELPAVLAELSRQGIRITAIHNHLVGEEPQITYVHLHAQGAATALAAAVDRVLQRTASPRPVTPTPAGELRIDTALVFRALGQSGRAQGSVAQLGFILVPGTVTMEGRVVVPALGYASPVNVQMVDAQRAVATGDLSVPVTKVDAVLQAFAAHAITATALHSHLVGESPAVRYIHFWADGSLPQVLEGLRAAIDAAR
jgi:Domain of Unknown Function (DUF1259)